MAGEESAASRGPTAFALVLIVTGFLLFPVAWAALVVGRGLEVQPLMRFLARSDAHVFFDLPGALGGLRAYPILFTLLPTTGVTLIAAGMARRRGQAWPRSVVVALGAGAAAFLIAWTTIAFVLDA